MAKIPINDPKHWRERAEEARIVADELTDADSKRRMLRIAEDCEELAKRAEKRPRDAGSFDDPLRGWRATLGWQALMGTAPPVSSAIRGAGQPHRKPK